MAGPGQKLDAERQVKKDAIELDRKIRFKKVPSPPGGKLQ